MTQGPGTRPMTTGPAPVLHPDLTQAQRDCLDALPLAGHHVVSGPPGSGKSLLAAHRTVHLALTGRPTLLLSRSNLLRQLLDDTLQGLTVPGARAVAATVHSWVQRHFGRDARSTDDGWFDWPALINRAADTFGHDDPATPHLVVDEGQDLPPGFYRLARLLGTTVTVFADECQRLTETHSTLTEITTALGRAARHVEIAGNHRNTREIFALAEHFRTGGPLPEPPGRTGKLPVVRHYAGPREIVDDIVTLAARRPGHRIGVIVASARTGTDLMRRLERAGLAQEPQLYSSTAVSGRYRDLDLTRPGVVLVHRASAKGLDFDAVFVPDAESDAEGDPTAATLRMTYYVMITRAREEVVLGWQGGRPPGHLEQLGGLVGTG
ncbi:ATP-binding domain-containing protein [Streptomyces sp. st77]|uniref:ATP-binding domain-containing protein n=1 Tax=Streptomyces sp. st77 TaxID=1828074 RepID=UPI00211D1EC5|nr:ATP-binding domain-containing protein [Streptomyces sp. st77]